MRKPTFGRLYWPTFLFLFLLSQNLTGQSGAIPINGTINKPDTKIALYELFYQNIDNNDIDPNEAELDDQFLVIKNHNAEIVDGKLILDGNKVFHTDLDELPFLPSVEFLDNGQIWPSEVEYYYDNYMNITSQEEMNETVNNVNNMNNGDDCIQLVVNDESSVFTTDGMGNPTTVYTDVFQAVIEYLSPIFCCPGSSPVTFVIQPTNEGLAAATPQYFGSQVDA